VRERDAVDLRRERAEAGLVRMRLRGQAQREQGASVERPLESDHGGPLREEPRELDRVLDRFGARVEERGLRRTAERRRPAQPLGKRDVDLVRGDREVRVREAAGLLLDRRYDARMGVADGQTADAAGEVDEGVAV